MATVEAILFDIGDVLEVNPRTDWREQWSAQLGIDVATLEERLGPLWAPGSIGAATLAEIETRTATAFGLDDATLTALMDDVWDEYVGELNVELAGWFSAARARVRTGIVSNSFVGAREREHAAHRLGELCEVIVYSHEEGCAKPDPRIYRIACDRLGIAPEAAVFVDDRSENVAGAEAIRMRGLRFTDNGQTIAALERVLGPDAGR